MTGRATRGARVKLRRSDTPSGVQPLANALPLLQVTRHAGGGELRLELVVPPREAEEWADRLSAAVAEFAGEALGEAQFAERLRRFRGERMLELESPEARARVLARQALVTGRTTGRLADVDGLTAARLHQAARSLPDPVIVFLGPFVEEDEEEGGGSRR